MVVIVALPSLTVIPMALIRRHLSMRVGTNISQWTRTMLCNPTRLTLVIIGMIHDLLLGVCIAAFHSQWAHINVAILCTLQRLDEWARCWLVAVRIRITAQPSSINIDVGKSAEGMIVVIPLRTPCGTKLGEALWISTVMHLRQMEAFRFSGICTSFSISLGSRKEDLPIVWSQNQVSSVSHIPDEFIVTAKNISSAANVFIEAKQN